MQWLRLYDDVLDDPKVQQLSLKMFRYWIKILCLANKASTRGRIENDLNAIAYRLRCSTSEAKSVLHELQSVGLLDREGDQFVPHNWDTRQKKSDSSAERVAAHRSRNATDDKPRNVTNLLPVTPPEQIQNRTEQNRSRVDPQTPKGPKPKKATQIDPAWEPDEVLLAWTRTKHISQEDVDNEVERFRNHYLGKGEARADWNASFRNWMTSPLRAQQTARASPVRAGPRRATAEDFFEMAGLPRQEQR